VNAFGLSGSAANGPLRVPSAPLRTTVEITGACGGSSAHRADVRRRLRSRLASRHLAAFHVKQGAARYSTIVIVSRPEWPGPTGSQGVARETAISGRSCRTARAPLRSFPTGQVIEPMPRSGTAAAPYQCPAALSARTIPASVQSSVDCGASRHRGLMPQIA